MISKLLLIKLERPLLEMTRSSQPRLALDEYDRFFFTRSTTNIVNYSSHIVTTPPPREA